MIVIKNKNEKGEKTGKKHIVYNKNTKIILNHKRKNKLKTS
jgi:hypothetical protein